MGSNERDVIGHSATVMLCVERIPFDLKEEGLRNYLLSRAQCPLLEVRLVKRKHGDTNLAYVTVRTKADAEKIISSLHLQPPLNLSVTVTRAASATAADDVAFSQNLEVSGKSPWIGKSSDSDCGREGGDHGSALPPDEVFSFNNPVTLAGVRSEELPPCSTCGRPAQVVCRRCLQSSYCSMPCQQQHWDTGGHKDACKDRQYTDKHSLVNNLIQSHEDGNNNKQRGDIFGTNILGLKKNSSTESLSPFASGSHQDVCLTEQCSDEDALVRKAVETQDYHLNTEGDNVASEEVATNDSSSDSLPPFTSSNDLKNNAVTNRSTKEVTGPFVSFVAHSPVSLPDEKISDENNAIDPFEPVTKHHFALVNNTDFSSAGSSEPAVDQVYSVGLSSSEYGSVSAMVEETEVGGKVDINEANEEKDIVRVNNNFVDLNVEDVGRETLNDAAAATSFSYHGSSRNTTAKESNLDPEFLLPDTWTSVADMKSFYLGSNLTLVIFVNHNRPNVQRHPFVGYFGKVNNFKNLLREGFQVWKFR